MSARPRAGAANPGRGGEGRRLRWSESAIPRRATRRIRWVGAEPPGYCVTGSIDTEATAGLFMGITGFEPPFVWTSGTFTFTATGAITDSTITVNLSWSGDDNYDDDYLVTGGPWSAGHTFTVPFSNTNVTESTWAGFDVYLDTDGNVGASAIGFCVAP